MLQKKYHPIVSISLVASFIVCLGLIAHVSVAGKKRIDPHKVVILCTGDNRGQIKPACT